MRTRIELLIATLLLVGIGVLAQSLKEARETRLRARLDSAKVQVRVDSVYVTRRVESVRTLRDTLLTRLTDTVLLKEYIYQTDTLRISCLACVESAARLRAASDSTIRALHVQVDALKPSRFAKYKVGAAFLGGVVFGAYVRGK